MGIISVGSIPTNNYSDLKYSMLEESVRDEIIPKK
jgi:hypothetical protein